MSTIRFEAKLSKIGSLTILRLPKAASEKLPSRGLTLVKGTINGSDFQAALEPDGKGSHWFKLDKAMLKAAGADTVKLEVEPSSDWPEPQVPVDLKKALAAAPQTRNLWMDITPLARWDWIRWINATKNKETRKIRIEKTLSKLNSGKRAACCFDRSQCTDPTVSSKGVLLEPTQK